MKIMLSLAAVCVSAVVAESSPALSADFAVEKGAVRRELHSSGYLFRFWLQRSI